jgi:ElaB/YqjD/DUF883 family membrane-anchored ribosome-binding protein
MDMANRIDTIVKSEALQDAKDRLAQANEQLGDLDQKVRRFVRDQPVIALLGAAFVGHMIGRMFARA